MDGNAAPGPLRVAVTGASGLIGSTLVGRLTADGHTVLRLVRHAPKEPGEARWDPASGSVVSASGGHVTTTRDSLEAAVRTFWDNVGHNMRDPTWQWTSMRVDVLAPNAAVMTATYRIPHRTPAGAPHVVGGAWTAVFERRAGRWVIVHEHLSDSPSP